MFTRFLKKDKACKKKGKEISLIVEDKLSEGSFVVKLPKRLLLEHSLVLRKMYENGELKKSKEIKLEGVTATSLEKIAEFIKMESVYFKSHYEAIDTLKATYIYQITSMQSVCSDFLVTIIDPKNVCEIYEFASDYAYHNVEYHCLKFIDELAEDILESPGFLTLKKATVLNIVRRHSLNVPNESLVFRSILTWGLNDCVKRGIDAEKAEEFYESVKSLMERVRFLSMSDEELQDPEVGRFYKLVHPEDPSNKRRSLLNLEFRPRSNTMESVCSQPRTYQSEFVHCLEIHSSDDHPVRNGESFCLRVEILKGRVFLTGVDLVFDMFVTMKNTACLYVAVSATNVFSCDQKCARGTFLNTSDDAELKFPSPLVARENDVIEIALNVKRAENICPMAIRSEVQIAMPEARAVAMKITPNILTSENVRSLYKSIKYFF